MRRLYRQEQDDPSRLGCHVAMSTRTPVSTSGLLRNNVATETQGGVPAALRPARLALACAALLGACGDDGSAGSESGGTGTQTTGMQATTSTGTSEGGDESSTGAEREGPEFDGEFVIATERVQPGDNVLVLVSSNPDGETLCIYAADENFDDVLALSIDVPPREIVIVERPVGIEVDSLQVRRGPGGVCPENANNNKLVFGPSVIVAFNNRIDVHFIPDAESAVNLEGRGHGAVINAGTQDAALCILDPEETVSDYSYFPLDLQNIHSLNDGNLSSGPMTQAFIVPGADEGCLTHTAWLGMETTEWFHSQENGVASFFVAFDGL